MADETIWQQLRTQVHLARLIWAGEVSDAERSVQALRLAQADAIERAADQGEKLDRQLAAVHMVLQDCDAAIDPETYPEAHAEIGNYLDGCESAACEAWNELERRLATVQSLAAERGREVERLTEDAKANASMLAQQCDLAREAEALAAERGREREETRTAARELLTAVGRSALATAQALYQQPWQALDEIMVDAGMPPKSQPEAAQAWLRERLSAVAKGGE